jgi:type IV pilus assembly protein PilA
MKNQKGFTLIELMIVVAIIAILAAIAISQYQDYVIRSQVSEGSSLADGMKTAVAEFNNNYGRFAVGSNLSYGLSLPASVTGSYVISVGIASGTGAGGGIIRAWFCDSSCTPAKKGNSAIKNLILAFSPITHAGSIEWNCKSTAGTSVVNKHRPTVCRD